MGIGREGIKQWGRSVAGSLTGLLVTGMGSGRAGGFHQSWGLGHGNTGGIMIGDRVGGTKRMWEALGQANYLDLLTPLMASGHFTT